MAEAPIVEKRGQGERGDNLKEIYEKYMIKACKEFVDFKRLFFPETEFAKKSLENKERMIKCYKFFDLTYEDPKNNIVKKRFELLSSNVKTRIKNELCCACKQPRTSMVMPCQFLKADCGHFIDGNCKDKQLEVKKGKLIFF